MCGIAGWLGWKLPEEERLPRLTAMCDAIRHRGPDDCGYFTDGPVGLGMRRLSIVDLAGGHQPMSTEDGAVTIVFNGEIFNHAELRHRLDAAGVEFRTRCDTEVILRLFAREGVEAFRLLNGMFAIAIWDARDATLHLVRDRMGVKPLYYHWDGSRLLFGSELKAILASGAVERRVNERALWDYLTFRFVPGPDSIWEGAHKLPPGHRLALRPGRAPEPVRYWDIPYTFPPSTAPEHELEEQFRALLDDAVNIRMVADVPVGITLSGGIDSATVTALAARRNSGRIKTFSVAFADSAATNELPYARLVAKHCGTDHHEVVIGQAEFLDFLPALVRFTDEPLADLASVPLYHVCRLARESVTVVLSGEGSDEILGGYDFELRVADWDRAAATPLGRLRRALGALAGPVPSGPDLRRAPLPPTMTNYLSSGDKRQLLRVPGSWPDSLDPLRQGLSRLGRQEPLHQVLYAFSQDWLVEDLLMKADKMSMAVSLEMRTPFLDYRLVEWAARTPARLKAGREADGSYRSKRVLRRLARELLPAAIVERPKLGFPVPVYDWLAGSCRDMAHDLLCSPATRCLSWLRPEALRRTVDLGTAAQAPILDRHRLWNLLILEFWAREWT